MPTLNLQVGANDNDGYEWGGDNLVYNAGRFDGSTFISSNDLFGGNNTCLAGFRFTNVTIPQGATINSATLTLRASSVNNNNPTNARANFHGADVDNVGAWSDTNSPGVVSATTAAVSFAPTAWVAGTDYTFTVTDLVQEIVDRAGWSSGNALGILTRSVTQASAGHASITDYAQSTTGAAKLDIDYSVASPQIARPTSTVSVGAWTDQASGTTDMHSPLADETDTTYIQSELDPASSFCEVALGTLTDPVSSTGHIVRYRYAKEPAGAHQMDLTVQLRQGSSTVIASATHANIGDTIVSGEFTLSGAEADTITNYSDLRLRFIGNQV